MNYRAISGRRVSSLLAATGASALMIAAAPATAQDAAAPEPVQQDAAAQPRSDSVLSGPGSADDVIVTGSRVVRDGYEAPTPLTVLTQEDIQNSSPTNNIADFVNQLPSLAGSTSPANSRLNLSSGQAGINALNLRNLGDIRTLVLVDGRRSVSSAITGQVDVNTIPQLLVERVEVVTGGASAAYGSDAVAGVVNFVLDKDYEGLKVSADSGVTTYGDGYNYSLGVAGGLSFADGRGHVLLSGELAHRDGIFQVTRDWNQIGFRTITDPPGYAPGNGRPRNIRVVGAGTNNALPGGIINFNSVIAGSGLTANGLRGIYFGQGGSVNQFDYGTLSTSTLSVGGDYRLADNSRNIGLDPQDDRHGVFGRVSFEVTPGIELFAEAAYNRQESRFNAGPQLSSSVVLQRDNAFLINTLGTDRLSGINSVTIGTTASDLPFRKSNNERNVQRYAIGAQGAFDLFGKPAQWDIYGQYGQTNTREQLRDIMHVTRIANATDAVFATAGNPGGFAPGTIVCRINVDTNPANDDRACVPLNRLGTGVANPAAFAYVLGDPYREQKLEQTTAGANLSTTPFATWAGDVSIAVGAEYRREKVSGFVPVEFQPLITPTATTNIWSVGNYLPTFGSYDVKEAYIETVVPLGFGLEFNGAARATDYSTAGYVTTWKAGATWQPIPDFRLRATRSRDIRAPNLNELFQAGSSNSDSVSNPFFDIAQPISRENPRSYSYAAVVTGNTNLRPEKADSLNLGGVLTPRFLPGFSASVDYFRIEIEDGIGSVGAQEIINRCFDGRQEFCNAYSVDATRSTPSADFLTFLTSPFNFSRQLVRGVDFEASYRLPLNRIFADADGDFTLRGLATRYIDNIVDNGIPGTISVNTVGANGGQFSTPKWLYRFNATYDTPTFSITGVGRGISSGKYIATAIECQTDCPISTTQAPTYDNNSLSGLFYADLNLTAKIDFAGGDSNGEVFLNVTNVFNRDPLLLPEGGLSANSTYSDLLGRAFRVGVRLRTR